MTEQMRLTLSFRTKTPPQWERFAKEHATQYDQAFPYQRVLLTDARWMLMCAIQREVNLRIRYKADPKGSDHWKVLLERNEALFGDCEDYALTKRTLLMEVAFPMGAVWPVMCMRGSQPHMVTVVSTNIGDYVLDQAQPDWIHDVADSKLKWISAYDGNSWRVATATLVTVPD